VRRLARFLSPEQRHWLWRAAVLARKIISRLVYKTSRFLPISFVAPVKEGLNPVGHLDYPGKSIKMTVDSSAQLERLRACRKEPETVSWLESHLRPGDVFFDIGANVGAYSLVADAMAGGKCTIYSFEPSHATFASLSKNILLNDCQARMIPLHFALWSDTGLMALGFSSTAPGAALHSLRTVAPEGGPYLLVPAYRLDDLVSRLSLRTPNLIKIDVDGDELAVLRGSEEVLASSSLRSVLVEVDESSESSLPIRHLMNGLGFHLASTHLHGGSSSTVANCIFEREGE
jgi:FkbM family methyltransferase